MFYETICKASISLWCEENSTCLPHVTLRSFRFFTRDINIIKMKSNCNARNIDNCFLKSFLEIALKFHHYANIKRSLHLQWCIICILENFQISPWVIFQFLPNFRTLLFYFASLFPLNIAKFWFLLATSSTLPDDEFSELLLIIFSALSCISFVNSIIFLREAWKNSSDSISKLFHSVKEWIVTVLVKFWHWDL